MQIILYIQVQLKYNFYLDYVNKFNVNTVILWNFQKNSLEDYLKEIDSSWLSWKEIDFFRRIYFIY